MTDPQPNTDSAPADVSEVSVVDDLSGDDLLAALAQLAQEAQMGLSLTVNVGGILYSGVTIGRDRWFDMIAEQAAGWSAAAGQVVGQIRDGMQRRSSADADAGKDIVYGYLHMRDVAVISGGTTVGPLKSLWRVRISEISAWMLGSYERSS
jgi:hypothetical protein